MEKSTKLQRKLEKNGDDYFLSTWEVMPLRPKKYKQIVFWSRLTSLSLFGAFVFYAVKFNPNLLINGFVGIMIITLILISSLILSVIIYRKDKDIFVEYIFSKNGIYRQVVDPIAEQSINNINWSEITKYVEGKYNNQPSWSRWFTMVYSHYYITLYYKIIGDNETKNISLVLWSGLSRQLK